MTNKPIIVIGAGMCGVSTAIWLQRLVREVILMDKGMPGMNASYENSSPLAQWAIDPVMSPSLWWEAPRYLTQKNSPLFMKWGYLPKMLPWLTIFITHANHADTKRIVKSLVPILSDAIDQHRSLVNGTSLEK